MTSAMINPLHQRIVEQIRRAGPLPFVDYMRTALYDPEYGYYVTGSAKMGWEGDYYTSSDVTPLFAHCLGRQLFQMWEQLGQPVPFTVLEQGAGRGDLSRQIRFWATREAPEFAAALNYRSGDISAGQDALQATATSSPQTTHTKNDLDEFQISHVAANEQLAPQVILSNELVDAFPVHIVEKQGDQLYEIYIAEKDGRLYEVAGAPSSVEVANYLHEQQVSWSAFEDGWRAEVNLNARRWMERTVHLLAGPTSQGKRGGFILTIDYGDLAKDLYIPERHQGTLTCYFHHQLSDQPLVRPGQQDITAHVNFSALIQAGQHQGLRLEMFTTQRQWLTEMGIYEELEQIRQRDFKILDSQLASDQGQIALLKWYNLRQRVTSLTGTSGLGNFKVLILASNPE
jgi:SAM-dependent MidA family methyltransferase